MQKPEFHPVPPQQPGWALRFLYHTLPGRILLKGLTRPALSRLAGAYLDSGLSRIHIRGFLRRNEIALEAYQPGPYSSFNACFTRQLRPGKRPIASDPGALIAPCDGALSVYAIAEDTVLPVKQSRYRLSDLLGDAQLAKTFTGGWCLVFRLCVQDYHRYAYPDDCTHGAPVTLPGVLHTVQPIALEQVPVFCRNARVYTLLETEHFGPMIQMEVGAMLVGRICNLYDAGSHLRGEEKGRFEFGGSTVILLVQAGMARVWPQLIENTRCGLETPVCLGQILGERETQNQ